MRFDPQGLGEARSETGWVCIRNVVPGETRRTEQRGSATRAAGTRTLDTHAEKNTALTSVGYRNR
jgi:hypothetical protein